MYQQNLKNDFICVKKIINFQDIIKKYDLNYKTKHGKIYNLVNIHHLLFLRDLHEGYLSLEDADNTQSNFATEFENFSKSIKAVKKIFFQ